MLQRYIPARRPIVNGVVATAGLVLLATIAVSSGVGADELQQPTSAPPSTASAPSAVFERYCITCHNDKVRSGGLALSSASLSNVGVESQVWEKVVRKLRTRAMPPGGRPRPDETTYDAVATWLETELDKAEILSPHAGRTETVHRLNRLE